MSLQRRDDGSDLDDRTRVHLRVLSLAAVAAGYVVVAVLPAASIAPLVLLSAFALSATCRYGNPYQMLWMGSHYAFCVLPAVCLPIFAGKGIDDIALVCTLYTNAFVIAADRLSGPWAGSGLPRVPSGFFVGAVLVFLLLTVGMDSAPLFGALLPALVLSYGLTVTASPRLRIYGASALLLLAIGAYTALIWSGFGRLVIAGAIATCFLWGSYAARLVIGRTSFFVLMGLGSVAGTLFRKGVYGETFAQKILHDSSFFVSMLGQAIFDQAPRWPASLRGIVDQFILFFIAPLPRSLWPGKPNGFGFAYVLDNYAPIAAKNGHSIAATFAGEHIYYMGNVLFHVSLIISLALFWLLCRVASDRRLLSGVPVIGALIYLPTFYWGGMQAFSVRFLLGLPVVIVLQAVLLAWPRITRGASAAPAA